jgi:hypothetical protein
MTNKSRDDIAVGGDLGATGGNAGSLGGGSREIAAQGGADIETAAASVGGISAADPTSSGIITDDEGSYPSAMTGSTNANAHTVGAPEGNTGSIRDKE